MSALIPTIIYEDESILLINKPSGLIVNRAETVRGRSTLMDWIESRTSNGAEYAGPAKYGGPSGTQPSFSQPASPSLAAQALQGGGTCGLYKGLRTNPNERAIGTASAPATSAPDTRLVKSSNETADSVPSAFCKLSEFEMRLGVIHRLDKDTSGVMVVAKTRKAFENIQSQFKERKVKKEYLALVHYENAEIKDPSFIVDAPIGRNPKNRMKWAVVEGGRSAVTEFVVVSLEYAGLIESEDSSESERPVRGSSHKVLPDCPVLSGTPSAPDTRLVRYSNETAVGVPSPLGLSEGCFALLRCFPRTGRTHQIRVHLTAVNCPVVCDKLYLGKRYYKSDVKWCPRIFLHAEKIGFTHPDSGEWVDFSAELPQDLKEVLAELNQKCTKLLSNCP